MRWYDYFVCIWIADGMAASIMSFIEATTIIDLLWYAVWVVIGYLSFVFYTDWRKEMIDQQK